MSQVRHPISLCDSLYFNPKTNRWTCPVIWTSSCHVYTPHKCVQSMYIHAFGTYCCSYKMIIRFCRQKVFRPFNKFNGTSVCFIGLQKCPTLNYCPRWIILFVISSPTTRIIDLKFYELLQFWGFFFKKFFFLLNRFELYLDLTP